MSQLPRVGHVRFDGNRALHLDTADPLPTEELRHGLALALTCHQRKAGNGTR